MTSLKELQSGEYWRKVGYSFASDKVSNAAIYEMVQSQLPGRENGPADAYRHLLLAAEMTRKMNAENAATRLNLHEETGNRSGQSKDANLMDNTNNSIGMLIGQQAKSWPQVVQMCRQAITSGYFAGQKVIWLQQQVWQTNPTDNIGNRMKNDDTRLNWPPKWPANFMPYPGNQYIAEPNSSISENQNLPVKIMYAENNEPYIKWNGIVANNLSTLDPIYQKIYSFLSKDNEFLALSQQEKEEEIKLFIEDGNQMYQASLQQIDNTPNQFAISPALKASLDAQAQENLQNQQGQNRGLG